jgi:transcriptional regulator with XRE-family HTH domain
MPQQPPRKGGRPLGATSFDPVPATAFGQVVQEIRLARGLAQEALALTAGVDRGFLGHLERGTRQASLAVVLKIAKALECRPSTLIAAVEERLPVGYMLDQVDGA